VVRELKVRVNDFDFWVFVNVDVSEQCLRELASRLINYVNVRGIEQTVVRGTLTQFKLHDLTPICGVDVEFTLIKKYSCEYLARKLKELLSRFRRFVDGCPIEFKSVDVRSVNVVDVNFPDITITNKTITFKSPYINTTCKVVSEVVIGCVDEVRKFYDKYRLSLEYCKDIKKFVEKCLKFEKSIEVVKVIPVPMRIVKVYATLEKLINNTWVEIAKVEIPSENPLALREFEKGGKFRFRFVRVDVVPVRVIVEVDGLRKVVELTLNHVNKFLSENVVYSNILEFKPKVEKIAARYSTTQLRTTKLFRQCVFTMFRGPTIRIVETPKVEVCEIVGVDITQILLDKTLVKVGEELYIDTNRSRELHATLNVKLSRVPSPQVRLVAKLVANGVELGRLEVSPITRKELTLIVTGDLTKLPVNKYFVKLIVEIVVDGEVVSRVEKDLVYLNVVSATTKPIEERKVVIEKGGLSVVSGVVLDVETNKPIPNAKVRLDGYEVTTDESGRFELTISPGRYELVVEAKNYEAAKYTVEVSTGERLELTLYLHPKPKLEKLRLAIPLALSCLTFGLITLSGRVARGE